MRTTLQQADKIVIKVGTNTLTHANGKMNLRSMELLVGRLPSWSMRAEKLY